jgi:hypothetical protein
MRIQLGTASNLVRQQRIDANQHHRKLSKSTFRKYQLRRQQKRTNESKLIEEDLEMRNTQIDDIRAKVMETDLDAKIKMIPENFKTMS